MIVIAERPRAQRAAEPHRYHGKGLKMETLSMPENLVMTSGCKWKENGFRECLVVVVAGKK